MRKFLLIPLLLFLYQGCSTQLFTNNNEKTNSERGPMETQDSLMIAVVKTNMGTFEIELYPDLAPKTVENFAGLAEKGYYNGVIFHRIIKNFVIQGGDPTGTGRGGQSIWGKPFKDEFTSTLRHDGPGILSMANAGPNTNGSQFFITLAATPWLDNKHSIFGKVISGMDVINSMAVVQKDNADRPLLEIRMEEVTIEKRKK